MTFRSHPFSGSQPGSRGSVSLDQRFPRRVIGEHLMSSQSQPSSPARPLPVVLVWFFTPLVTLGVLVHAAWIWIRWRLGLIRRVPREVGQTPAYGPPPFSVLCLSHVAWSHIWQRNHHTMTRLAKARPVIYVQVLSTCPIHAFLRNWPGTYRTWTTRQQGVDLVHPLLIPGERRFFFIRLVNQWILRTLCRAALAHRGIDSPVLWYYHPAAEHLVHSLKPSAVVYDIQDEYSAFRGADPLVTSLERKLLGEADVMLAGTFALHESKRVMFGGNEAGFYPCAVEFPHFHSAAPRAWKTKDALPAPPPAPELAGIEGPILFYMGLIDKRLDPAVIEALAGADGNWTIVLAGPVEPGAFPAEAIRSHYANVRFLGSVPYRRLPEFLLRSDVCLMPWAVNDLTLHINPTKTLEYLATAKPVVSIRLPDLEAFYRDTVWLADSEKEFVELVRWVLQTKETGRIALGLQRAAAADWDTQVAQMAAHVDRALEARRKSEISTKSLHRLKLPPQ
jgi:glycosyltransferase involved in cell wall biosynthesis